MKNNLFDLNVVSTVSKLKQFTLFVSLRSIKKQQSVISYHCTVQLYLKESLNGELEIFRLAILKNQEDRR